MSAQSEPAWLTLARDDIGFHETGENRGIEKFIASAHTGSIGDPWCAIWTNAKLEDSGVRGTRSPAARSFERDSGFSRLLSPILGCIVTLWRGSPNGGQGHVGFYLGESGNSVTMLCGNDDDQVEIKDHPKDRVTGYWWPIAVPAQPSIPAPQLGSSSRFNDCLAVTLKWEGGNDDDPRDPGGRTSRGILQSEWDAWRQTHPGLPTDVWQAPQEQIVAIYRQEYWDRYQCDQFPPGVDLCVFDSRVLSGGAIKFIQRAVGADDDGEIGPLTITAARNHPPKDVINAICDARMTYLRSLAGWPTFGNGWTNRVTDVRAQSLATVGTTPTEPPMTTLPIPAPPASGLQLDPAALANLIQLATLALQQKTSPAPTPPAPEPATGVNPMGAAFAALGPWIVSVLPQIGAIGLALMQSLVSSGVLGPAIGAGATPTGTTVGSGLAATIGVGLLNWIKTALTTKWQAPAPPAPPQTGAPS